MDFQYLVIFLLSLISITYFIFLRTNHHEPQTILKSYPLIGILPQFLKNRHRINDWLAEVLSTVPANTVTVLRLGNIRGVITANPANIEHILKTNFDNYPKGPRIHSLLGDFLGSGIFNSDGHLWKTQRKTTSFEFNTGSLRNFVVSVVHQETVTRLLPFLEKSAAKGEVVDMQDVLERYAFDNVCKVAFGEDPACLDNDNDVSSPGFADAFRNAANLSTERFLYAIPGFWKIKKMLAIGSERRLEESIAVVHDFATRVIRSRVKAPTQADDLLSRFLAKEEFSEEFLRDIVISFILAGRETTSSALTWFFWLMSSRPDVERKVLEEIASARADSSDGITFEFEELKRMQYMHAAITEAMRLYPPVPNNTLYCRADDVLPDGTEIKKGWFVSYQSYAMGRMESVWGKDCYEYKPERWLDGEGMFRPESPFKFLAFHAGPRICLGKEMAYIQMKSVAAAVLERFAVDVVEKGKCPEQLLSLTLRMRGGLPVRLIERS